VTPLEAASLCKLAKSACPQQAIDEYTPDIWHPLLKDLRFEDARDGLIEVVKRQPFVAPAEIRAAAKRIRDDRISAFGPLPNPPAEVEEDPNLYSPWMGELLRRIGDGELVAEPTPPPDLEQQERIAELVSGAFQEVPRA
jgi:hypothetical protein